jgi:hypothetical protein
MGNLSLSDSHACAICFLAHCTRGWRNADPRSHDSRSDLRPSFSNPPESMWPFSYQHPSCTPRELDDSEFDYIFVDGE